MLVAFERLQVRQLVGDADPLIKPEARRQVEHTMARTNGWNGLLINATTGCGPSPSPANSGTWPFSTTRTSTGPSNRHPPEATLGTISYPHATITREHNPNESATFKRQTHEGPG